MSGAQILRTQQTFILQCCKLLPAGVHVGSATAMVPSLLGRNHFSSFSGGGEENSDNSNSGKGQSCDSSPDSALNERRDTADSSSSVQVNADRRNMDMLKSAREMADYYAQYENEFYEPVGDIPPVAVQEKASPIPLQRGKRGVFDVDELVVLLRAERAQDIVCIAVPKEAVFAEHIVICSGFSKRHIVALAEAIRLYYKKKCEPTDAPLLKYPQQQSGDVWRALDIGNIVLHIMSPQVRVHYDIEQLWSVGPEFDEQTAGSIDSLSSYLPPQKTTNVT